MASRCCLSCLNPPIFLTQPRPKRLSTAALLDRHILQTGALDTDHEQAKERVPLAAAERQQHFCLSPLELHAGLYLEHLYTVLFVSARTLQSGLPILVL